MTPSWPPSPSVEDEESALAHEHLIDARATEDKSEDQPAGSRGTVNQYPIILDIVDAQLAATDAKHKSVSSDESCGPPTPPFIDEKPRTASPKIPEARASTDRADRKASRSRSRARVERKESPRGRPNLSHIKTDIGSNKRGMVTGHERAPSPYAFTPAPLDSGKAVPVRRFSGEQLLSPPSATIPQYGRATEQFRRPIVVRSRSVKPHIETATDTYREQDKPHSRSRRRYSRETLSSTQQPHLTNGSLSHARNGVSTTQPAMSAAAPPAGGTRRGASSVRERNSTAEILGHSRESPYTSSAEESRPRPSHRRSRNSQRSNLGSPDISSGDEQFGRVSMDGGHTKSRRSSMQSKHRPHVKSDSHDQSNPGWEDRYEKSSRRRHDSQHYPLSSNRSYPEPMTPLTTRSPQAAESMWAKAFEQNRVKAAHSAGVSANQSPYISPAETPPMTSRVDRRPNEMQDFPPPLQPPQWRSRAISVEQHGYLRDLKRSPTVTNPSTSFSTSHAVPPNSRTSAVLMETPSSGSVSKPSSGQRSRKPSPVYEELHPPSRGIAHTNREDHVLQRSLSSQVSEERPTSRGSPHGYPPSHHPRLAQRAFSYNTTVDPSGSRPPSTHQQATALPSTPATTEHALPHTQTWPFHAPYTVPLTQDYNTLQASETAPLPLPPPCPRSTPCTGYTDWYTISNISDIDICPSCMSTLGSSRFRDHFVPSMPKHRNQEIKCSFSNPWFRIAWTQVGKQNRPNLEMLWRLTGVLHKTRPCHGRTLETRTWYCMIDPSTRRPLPNFDVCSACVNAIDTVFPNLEGVLGRHELAKECSCSLHAGSGRFSTYVHEFDKAHIRCGAGKWRKSDVQPLADYIRETARLRECPRDSPQPTSAWHYMPDFPNFTVCEECYHRVIWPVVEQPIARNFNRTLRLVPVTRSGHFVTGRTCQLYSDRMRRYFKDAVKTGNWDVLREAAVERLETEQIVQERRKVLLSEVRAGLNRSTELEELERIWRTWE